MLEAYEKVVLLLPKKNAKSLECQTYLKKMGEFNSALRLLTEKIKSEIDSRKDIKLKKKIKVKPSDFISAIKILENYSPDYAGYINLLYSFYVDNQNTTIATLIKNYFSRHPRVFEGYIDLWKVANIIGDTELQFNISEIFAELLEKFDTPIDIWIKGNVINAKTLLKSQQYDKAISILKQIAQILPSLPLPSQNPFDNYAFSIDPIIALSSPIIQEDTQGEENAAVELRVSILGDDEIIAAKVDTPDAPKQELIEDKAKLPNDYAKSPHHRTKSSLYRDHMIMQEIIAKQNTGKRSRVIYFAK